MNTKPQAKFDNIEGNQVNVKKPHDKQPLSDTIIDEITGGRVAFSDLSFVQTVNKASPKLF